MLDSKIAALGCLGLLLGVAGAHAVTCPPASSLLLEVRHEAQSPQHRPAVTVNTVEGVFVCKNALGTRTETASSSVFAIAPDVTVARASAPLLAAALNAALSQFHVGVLESCSLAAPEGTSEYFAFVWHGRGARANRFAIGIGFTDLYPPCGAAAKGLLAAVRAYAAGLPLAPGAEVYTFPR